MPAEAFQADVSLGRPMSIACSRNVLSRFGRLDVLVTAAAVWEPKPLEDVTADDVRRQFEINTLGTFLCCRQAGLIMAGQPEGRRDRHDRRLGHCPAVSATMPPISLSKGAIPAITRTLAVELALRNPAVRVNCILPGPVMLPDDLSAEERSEAVAGTLVKRQGRPGKRRPCRGVPRRERLRDRRLPAGRRRPNDRRGRRRPAEDEDFRSRSAYDFEVAPRLRKSDE